MTALPVMTVCNPTGTGRTVEGLRAAWIAEGDVYQRGVAIGQEFRVAGGIDLQRNFGGGGDRA